MSGKSIVRPYVTEKSSQALEKSNKYTLLVPFVLNKIEIKNLVQKEFGVKAVSVNLISLKGKKRRRGKIVGESKPRRKAIITVPEGIVIDEIKKLF